MTTLDRLIRKEGKEALLQPRSVSNPPPNPASMSASMDAPDPGERTTQGERQSPPIGHRISPKAAAISLGVIDKLAYEVHPTTYTTHTAYEPPAAPASMHVYDETGQLVPQYLQGVRFPATKQDLLRAARVNMDEPAALRKLEQLADRSYSSLHDLMMVLGTV